MHVKVDHGDALGIILGTGVQPGDGDVVENAKSHRDGTLGMMATGANGAKGVLRFAGHHLVNCADTRTHSTQRCLPALWAEHRVAIYARQSLFRYSLTNGFDILTRMRPLNVVHVRQRSIFAHQRIESWKVCHQLDGAQPVRSLGMSRSRVMLDTNVMCEIKSCHSFLPNSQNNCCLTSFIFILREKRYPASASVTSGETQAAPSMIAFASPGASAACVSAK